MVDDSVFLETFDYVVDDNSDVDFSNNLSIYFKEIRMYPLLTFDEEKELAIRIAEGDQLAKKKFIECNLKLVVSIAKRYVGNGLSLSDLIQEGNLGLLTAVERFDASKNYRFSTYATYWIKDSIYRAIADTGRNIRVPVYIHRKLLELRSFLNEYRLKNGKDPSVDELSFILNISVDDVKNIFKYMEDTVSLSSYTSNKEEMELDDFIVSDEVSLDSIVIEENMQKKVNLLINSSVLNDREREVLKLYYGFYDNRPYTLLEIGDYYNISKQRVYQIIKKSLKKLSSLSDIVNYAEFMDDPEQAMINVDRNNLIVKKYVKN